jgi:hypothetical protein
MAWQLPKSTPTMYEENLTSVPDGDFSTVFAELLGSVEHVYRSAEPAPITPANVLFFADRRVQPYVASICRRLLLPGSGIAGSENLAELTRLASAGRSCIVCLNHQSNLDVPTLHALLEDQGNAELFQHVIWIAGRKLHEDVGATRMLVQGFNRVIVSPRSWMKEGHSVAELHEAHQLNMAAHRTIHELRHQGWVFALFPTATRVRPQNESTKQAIEETDSYLKYFEFMLLGRIDGCTLPVSRDHDLTREMPRRDTMRYTFGAVLQTDAWRADAARRYPRLDQRAATARAIMQDIMAIARRRA